MPPFQRPHMRAVHDSDIQVKTIQRAELVQQQFVHRGKHSRFGPVASPPPARHPGTSGNVARQLAEGDPGCEHEHDPRQRSPVIHR